MGHQPTFSLTQLADVTGKGKAGLRDMIASGRLVATREESGRREWIVKREDALAANLRLPIDTDHRPGPYVYDSTSLQGAPGVDAALRCLLVEMLSPIEARLARLESQSVLIASLLGAYTDPAGVGLRPWLRVLAATRRRSLRAARTLRRWLLSSP